MPLGKAGNQLSSRNRDPRLESPAKLLSGSTVSALSERSRYSSPVRLSKTPAGSDASRFSSRFRVSRLTRSLKLLSGSVLNAFQLRSSV